SSSSSSISSGSSGSSDGGGGGGQFALYWPARSALQPLEPEAAFFEAGCADGDVLELRRIGSSRTVRLLVRILEPAPSPSSSSSSSMGESGVKAVLPLPASVTEPRRGSVGSLAVDPR